MHVGITYTGVCKDVYMYYVFTPCKCHSLYNNDTPLYSYALDLLLRSTRSNVLCSLFLWQTQRFLIHLLRAASITSTVSWRTRIKLPCTACYCLLRRIFKLHLMWGQTRSSVLYSVRFRSTHERYSEYSLYSYFYVTSSYVS
jgi:hypothetical protein